MSEDALLKQIRLIVKEEVNNLITNVINPGFARLEKKIDAGDNALLELIKGLDFRITTLSNKVDALEKNMNKKFDLIALKLKSFSDFRESITYRVENIEILLSTKLKETAIGDYAISEEPELPVDAETKN